MQQDNEPLNPGDEAPPDARPPAKTYAAHATARAKWKGRRARCAAARARCCKASAAADRFAPRRRQRMLSLF